MGASEDERSQERNGMESESHKAEEQGIVRKTCLANKIEDASNNFLFAGTAVALAAQLVSLWLNCLACHVWAQVDCMYLFKGP